ncbi:MAG: hypothetical protein ACLUCU_02355 [Slackia sp.]
MSEEKIAPVSNADTAEAEQHETEMHDPTYGISREEAAELRMLVSVERDGGDVAYAAFHSLCPTGEEFAFDDKACAVYRVLARRGMIEGADTENGFLFFNLTQEGRDALAAYDELHKDDEAETKAPRARFSFSLDRFDIDKTTAITSAAVAAAVGFIAGILGALVGNALM